MAKRGPLAAFSPAFWERIACSAKANSKPTRSAEPQLGPQGETIV